MQDAISGKVNAGNRSTFESNQVNKKRKQQFDTGGGKKKSNRIVPIYGDQANVVGNSDGDSLPATDDKIQQSRIGDERRSNRIVPIFHPAPQAAGDPDRDPGPVIDNNLQQLKTREDKPEFVSAQDRLEIARQLGTPWASHDRTKWHPLSMREGGQKFLPLESRRLKVAGDFGMNDSAIGWDGRRIIQGLIVVAAPRVGSMKTGKAVEFHRLPSSSAKRIKVMQSAASSSLALQRHDFWNGTEKTIQFWSRC